MTRFTVDLDTPENVLLAKRAIDRAFAAGGMIAEFKEATRTTEQNKKLWPMLTEIAKARPVWNSFPMNAQRWKGTFMDALGIETDATPSLEGGRVIPLGHRSSQLSKRQFSDLIELIQAFAAKEGIDLKEPPQTETGKAA
jgi:hypothetical protein